MLRLCLALLLLVPVVLPAQSAPERPADSLPPAPSPAFGRPELRGFALSFAAGGVAYFADQSLRDAVRGAGPQGNRVLDGIAAYGNPFGAPGVLGLGAAMYAGGLLTRQPTIAATGFRAIESIAVSGLVTSTFKGLLGRARPETNPTGADDFQFLRGARLGNDYQSMPSGHTTAAFAFATAVTLEVKRRAPRHARWVAAATYASAVATAYARMHDDRHWFSDVVVGAGVGSVTAAAIHRWHATRPADPIDGLFLRPVLQPRADGAAIRFTATFR